MNSLIVVGVTLLGISFTTLLFSLSAQAHYGFFCSSQAQGVVSTTDLASVEIGASFLDLADNSSISGEILLKDKNGIEETVSIPHGTPVSYEKLKLLDGTQVEAFNIDLPAHKLTVTTIDSARTFTGSHQQIFGSGRIVFKEDGRKASFSCSLAL